MYPLSILTLLMASHDDHRRYLLPLPVVGAGLCRNGLYNFTTKSFDPITPDCTFGPVVDNTGQAGYTGKDSNQIAG
jgi:hypothetical protein